MFRAVTAGFFDTFGVRVAMVNERFADRFLGGLC
jgi:hypothetical protein